MATNDKLFFQHPDNGTALAIMALNAYTWSIIPGDDSREAEGDALALDRIVRKMVGRDGNFDDAVKMLRNYFGADLS